MGAIANLHASLRWDLDDFQRGTRTIEDAFSGIINLAGKVGDAVANLGRKLTIGVTLPLTGLGVVLTKTAADAAELQSAFDYTFGNMSKRMNRWAEETGDAMGRATGEMQEGALRFGQLFKAAAPTEVAAARLSQRFTELAQDAASFFNTDFDTAMGKIRSGLTGESEPLRDFGVFLSETAVKAKAVELGLIDAGQEVNEYGKIMARAALISEGLADAQGDIERTSDSLANRVRKIKGDLRELAEEIGRILEPYAQKLATAIERLVAWIKGLPEGVKRAAVGFGLFLAALGPISIALSALAVTILPLFLVRLGPVFAALSAIINPIGTLVVMAGRFITSFGGIMAIASRLGPVLLRVLGPVGLVITAFQLFGDYILRGLERFWEFVSEAFGNGMASLFASLGTTVERVREAFARFMESPLGEFLLGLVDVIGIVLEAFITFAGYLTGKLITAVFEVLTFIADWVGGMVETTTKLLTGDWSGAWDAAVETVGRAVLRIGEWIEYIWPWLGGIIKAIGEITGAELSMPKVKTGNSWADAPVTQGKTGNSWADAPVSESTAGMDYALPQDPKKPKSGSRGSRGRSGPTPEELAARREEIRLQQQLDLARETGDYAAIRALERQRDLKDRIERYERAGLSISQAKAAAEKDMAEIDEARRDALQDYLRERRIETEYQVAVINNDHEHLRYLDEEHELKSRINELAREGYDLAVAERIARDELLQIEQAREEAAARRLRDQQEAHELELARLRGDSASSIRVREESLRTRDRVEDLMDSGGMSRADAEAQAMREAADRAQAHMQGTFRDAFRNGLEAALNGNLKSFFEGWLRERSFNALSRVLDQLADSLANLLAGTQGQGGILGSLGALFGYASGGSASGGAVASAAKSVANLPKFNSGGGGILRGYPGIDTNLLSLNGNPIARVSSGELLDIQPANGNGRDRVGAGGNTFNISVGATGNPAYDRENASMVARRIRQSLNAR